MLDWIFDPNAWIALLTLTALEIVLGIAFSLLVELLDLKIRRKPTA